MSTTNGTMKSFRVTDPNGNVYILTPVDTTARTAAADAKAVADEAAEAIDRARDLTFDERYFIPDETDTEVNITLNGVPFGVDDETPLQILQDTQDGVVLGADSPFNSAIAPPFDGTSAYKVRDHVTYKSKLYRCTTAIVTPSSAWDPSHWTETSVVEAIDSAAAVTDVIITSADNSTISFVADGVADLTPLYTYINGLEARIAALEAAQDSDGITVNGIQPTVNGNTITVGE